MFMKLAFVLMMWWIPGCNPPDHMESPRQEPPVEITNADVPPQAGTAVTSDAPPDVAHPQLPAKIDDLLNRLENNIDDLQGFTADVQYEKEDALLGRKETRTGDLIYQQHRESKAKSFAILFEHEIVQNVRRNHAKHYIFDGRWLAEVDHANRQFIKREIVAPGKQLDPLRLGEGPFPLPIGQRKSEVLTRFDVAGATLPETGLLKNLQNVEGLSLVPKADAREAKDYASVELFYDTATLLPVGISIVETNGDRKTVRLQNVKRNPELSDEQKKRLDIREPNPREWRIDVRPWNSG